MFPGRKLHHECIPEIKAIGTTNIIKQQESAYKYSVQQEKANN